MTTSPDHVPVAAVVAPVADAQPDIMCPRPGSDLDPEPETTPAPSPTRSLVPGRVPDGFGPVAAVECVTGDDVTDAQGRWSTFETVRYEGDVQGLVDALATPDERAPVNAACNAIAEAIPDLWLVDASGRAVLVHWPRDACGLTQDVTRTALSRMTVASTTTTRRTLAEPAAAIDSGCSTGWKLMPPGRGPTVADGAPDPATVAPASGASDDGARSVCRYAVDPAQAIGEGAAVVQVGTFASGERVPGARLAAAVASSADPAPRCTRTPTSFAVIDPSDKGGAVRWVELDGCHRTWTDGSTATRASVALLALVRG